MNSIKERFQYVLVQAVLESLAMRDVDFHPPSLKVAKMCSMSSLCERFSPFRNFLAR